jgi:hypothetical protein
MPVIALSRELGTFDKPLPIGNDIFVNSGGGILEEPFAQEAIYRTVDWVAVAETGSPGGGEVTANLGEETIDLTKLFYDPDKTKAYLDAVRDEFGYIGDPPITVLFPAQDKNLGSAAQLIAKDLSVWDIGAEVAAVSQSELSDKMKVFMLAGMPVIALTR